jgi:ABC-type transport system substrate-binding protein
MVGIRGTVILALALALVACVAGCSTSAPSTPGPLETASIGTPASDNPAGSGPINASPVTGVLTHIDAAGLSEVTGFTLRLADGTEMTFRIGILENGNVFPPGHLAEHLATSAPVRVFFRVQGADLVVYRLEDGS